MKKLKKITKQNVLQSIGGALLSVGIVQIGKFLVFHKVGTILDLTMSVVIITLVLIGFNTKNK